MDTYRISVVMASSTEYIDEDSLLHTLYPHLCFEEVSYETYLHIRSVLPKGSLLLVDYQSQEGRGSGVELDIERALADYEAAQVREEKNPGKPQKGTRQARASKKKTRKGLTPKQARELEKLREELRDV